MHKKDIGKAIGIGMLATGIVAAIVLYLYLNVNVSQIFGKEIAETTIYSDSQSGDIIVNALNRISQQEQINVSDYITDIHVVNDVNDAPCTKPEAPGQAVFGCEIPHSNIFGLVNVSIYVVGSDSGRYSDVCLTFEHVVYHEIGHTLYQLKYGIPSKEDDIYRKSLETYADGIADKYVPFDKTKKIGCKEYYLAQEVERANQTLNIARKKLEEAKTYLDSSKIAMDDAENNVASDKTLVIQYNNEVIAWKNNVESDSNELITWKNRVSQCGFLCQVLDKSGYNQALSRLNSAQNKYNSDINIYNSAVDKYNSANNKYNTDATIYKKVVDTYNQAVNEYNDALKVYNSASYVFA